MKNYIILGAIAAAIVAVALGSAFFDNGAPVEVANIDPLELQAAQERDAGLRIL